MNKIKQLSILVILLTSITSLSARDYSYMNDHIAPADVSRNTSPATITNSTVTPSLSNSANSIVDSIIDAAVTTGVETADQTIGTYRDSLSGRFYNNLRKGDQEALPSGEGVYIREDDGWKHDNRDNDRNRRDWGRSQGKGNSKNKKWRKNQYKSERKLHKEQYKRERKSYKANKKYDDYDDREQYYRSKKERREYYKDRYDD